MAIELGKRPVSTSAAQVAYDTLREKIINFVLPPMTQLSRTSLSHEMGVSLTPLREAMMQLEQDGLIHIFPQSKTIVSKIDVAELRQSHFLRQAIETEVVRALTLDPDPAALARARALVQMQKSLIGQGDQMELFASLDREFHLTLFDAVGMGELHRMVSRRQGHMARCRRLDLTRTGKMNDIVHAHSLILDAVEAGDPVEATAAMRQHLSGTIIGLSHLRQTYPDYFTGAV